jgi:hypothetical protein
MDHVVIAHDRSFPTSHPVESATPLSRTHCAQILRDQVEAARQRLAAHECDPEEFAAALQRFLDLVLDGKLPEDLVVS